MSNAQETKETTQVTLEDFLTAKIDLHAIQKAKLGELTGQTAEEMGKHLETMSLLKMFKDILISAGVARTNINDPKILVDHTKILEYTATLKK